jgi:hypothetical protein
VQTDGRAVLEQEDEMRRSILALATIFVFAALPLTAAAKPDAELAYADGEAYTMLGVNLITNASPGILSAPPLYVLGYVPPDGSQPGQPITLPSGYQPQCNPCLQEPIAYHDHLLTGAPGQGTDGTSGGDYRAPWRIVLLLYNPAWSNRPDFEPITRDDQLAAAEAAGEFLPINAGAPDPYEIWTPNVLVCPVVRHDKS